jgi:hypothetical protein
MEALIQSMSMTNGAFLVLSSLRYGFVPGRVAGVSHCKAMQDDVVETEMVTVTDLSSGTALSRWIFRSEP